MNIIEKIEKNEIAELTKEKQIPEFAAGDTLRVNVKVFEGSRSRVQAYEGVCIARKNDAINSSFTVRKLSYGEGVERVFPLYSPLIDIDVVRRGKVRRAKLYYLRGLTGKKARIAEKTTYATDAAKKAAAKAPKKAAAKTEAPKEAPAAKAEDKA